MILLAFRVGGLFGQKAFAEGYPSSQKQRNRLPILCIFTCFDCNFAQSNILFAHSPGTQEEPKNLGATSGTSRHIAETPKNHHWRRRELNPRPDTDPNKRLRVYPIL